MEVVAWSAALAFKTANLTFSVLKSILRDAFLDGTVSTDLSAKIRPPRRQKDDAPQLEAALSLEQLRLVLQAAENEENPWRTLLHLAAETGARVGEICALRWNDIAKDGTISVNGSMSGTERKSTKTGATREVTISPDTLRRLQEMRGQTNSIYIFATQSGAPMNQPAISRFMKKILCSIGGAVPECVPAGFPFAHSFTTAHSCRGCTAAGDFRRRYCGVAGPLVARNDAENLFPCGCFSGQDSRGTRYSGRLPPGNSAEMCGLVWDLVWDLHFKIHSSI